MLTRIRKAQENNEGGFTLIELLVVIIIIGILASVAIPVFLNQRKKGYDTASKSDLKNAATAQETVLTDDSAYATGLASLTAAGFKPTANVTLSIVSVRGTSDSYCMRASHASNPGTTWYIDSATGSTPSKTACT